MSITMLAAIDENYGIGYNNKLLCKLQDDMKHFVNTTKNSIIIMGYNTWRSLPRVSLPNRFNIVITNQHEELNKEYNILRDGCSYHDLHEFTNSPTTKLVFISYDEYQKLINDAIIYDIELYVIGGSMLYNDAFTLDNTNCMIITHIRNAFDRVDTFFPKIDFSKYKSSLVQKINKSIDNDFDCEINKYIKI